MRYFILFLLTLLPIRISYSASVPSSLIIDAEVDAEILFPEEKNPISGRIVLYHYSNKKVSTVIHGISSLAAILNPAFALGHTVPTIQAAIQFADFEYFDQGEKKRIPLYDNPFAGEKSGYGVTSQLKNLIKKNKQSSFIHDSSLRTGTLKKLRLSIHTRTEQRTTRHGGEVTAYIDYLVGDGEFEIQSLDKNHNLKKEIVTVNIDKLQNPYPRNKFQPADQHQYVLPLGDNLGSKLIYMGNTKKDEPLFVRRIELAEPHEHVVPYFISRDIISALHTDSYDPLLDSSQTFLPYKEGVIEPRDYVTQFNTHAPLNVKAVQVQNVLSNTGQIQRIWPCQRILYNLIEKLDQATRAEMR